MELPAAGGTVGVHRLKELYCRGNYYRQVPILRGQRPADFLRRRTVREVKPHTGVMLQHIVVSQDIPKDRSILLNNGGIGDHVDHPPHPVLHRMAQREGQGRHRLSTAGGNRQGIDAAFPLSFLQTGIQDLAAEAVQFRCRCLPFCDIRLQAPKERQDIVVPTPPSVSLHELLRIQEIRVYQAGVEHPRPEGSLQPVLRGRTFPGKRWQTNAAVAAAFQIAFLPSLLKPAKEGHIPRLVHFGTPKVRQTGMMPHNAGRRIAPPQ